MQRGQARYYTFTFCVYDANKKIVANHDRQWKAVNHANKINGTWRRERY